MSPLWVYVEIDFVDILLRLFGFICPGVLPEALKTRCGACTEVQKAKALDVITRLYYDHPKMYLALVARYDPSGEYTRNFESWYDEQNTLKSRPPGKEQRIPSTWITSSTRTTTTTERSTTRILLRTQPPTLRTSSPRIPTTLRQREEPVAVSAPLTTLQRAQPTATVFREPPNPVTFSSTFRPSTPRQPPTTERQTNPPVFREPTTLRALPVPITEPSTTFRATQREPTVVFTQPTPPPRNFPAPVTVFEAPEVPQTVPQQLPTQPTFRAPPPPPTNEFPVQRIEPTFNAFPATVNVQPTTLTQFPAVQDPTTFRQPDGVRFQPAPVPPRRPVSSST
jgi:Insect pheromone-binding family, A10/OS-D